MRPAHPPILTFPNYSSFLVIPYFFFVKNSSNFEFYFIRNCLISVTR